MQAHRLHIKIAELSTHSDGNGITGIPSAVFFNEMGNKKKKIKRRRKLCTRRNCTLSHFSNANFEKFLMTAISIKVAQLKSFGWKIPEYCNTFTYSFEAERQEDLFFFSF